jgi:hypothetical protein
MALGTSGVAGANASPNDPMKVTTAKRHSPTTPRVPHHLLLLASKANTTSATINQDGGESAVPRLRNSLATSLGLPGPPNCAGHPAATQTSVPRVQTAKTRVATERSILIVDLIGSPRLPYHEGVIVNDMPTDAARRYCWEPLTRVLGRHHENRDPATTRLECHA